MYRITQELKQQGLTINQIRLQVGRHHSTIARLYGADIYPALAPRKRRKQAMPFETYMRQRWDAGCHNAKRLFREIKAQGYGGSSVTIRRYVRQWRTAPASLIYTRPLPKVPSPRTAVWLLLKPEERLTDEDRRLIAEIVTLSPTIKSACDLVEEFRRVVRARQAESLTTWMESVAKSELVDFENFVTHLRRDEAAVRAGLTHAWSNGPTEGQVNRLKYIKRQMFGRANFDLLKARVLHAN